MMTSHCLVYTKHSIQCDRRGGEAKLIFLLIPKTISALFQILPHAFWQTLAEMASVFLTVISLFFSLPENQLVNHPGNCTLSLISQPWRLVGSSKLLQTSRLASKQCPPMQRCSVFEDGHELKFFNHWMAYIDVFSISTAAYHLVCNTAGIFSPRSKTCNHCESFYINIDIWS